MSTKFLNFEFARAQCAFLCYASNSCFLLISFTFIIRFSKFFFQNIELIEPHLITKKKFHSLQGGQMGVAKVQFSTFLTRTIFDVLVSTFQKTPFIVRKSYLYHGVENLIQTKNVDQIFDFRICARAMRIFVPCVKFTIFCE